MASADYRIRRATVDDLPALRELWEQFGFPALELEKRVTEMQVAETHEGKIAAALGFKIERLHGLIHTEAVPESAENGAMHEAFWQRLQVLARNHGLFRIWTHSPAPFWATLGFQKPDPKAIEKLPAAFGPVDEKLITHTIREESPQGLSVEQEFELFSQAQKLETERLMRQAEVFKKIAYTIIFVVCGGFLVMAAIRILNSPRFRNRR
jgi:N-acetylglutamate synthase-like GNAT family acetyltransferase